MINELVYKIKEYETIIVLRHTRPDLDALGSQRGLALSIKESYPNKKVYMTGDMTDKYAFLGEMDTIDDSVFKDALVIICDVAIKAMVSDDRYTLAKEIFVIDHHTNDSDATKNVIIKPSVSSTAELITDIMTANYFRIPKEAATALYAGIISDTGRFQYNPSASTFRAAAKLVELGADYNFIYDNIYVETLSQRRMKNYFSNKFEVTKNGVAYIKNDLDVFNMFDVDVFTVSRGMVNVMSGIDEIKIWCNFTFDKTKNAVLCEFRSRGIKIVDIAKNYGGGGHNFACGATIESFAVADKIIADFDRLLEE